VCFEELYLDTTLTTNSKCILGVMYLYFIGLHTVRITATAVENTVVDSMRNTVYYPYRGLPAGLTARHGDGDGRIRQYGMYGMVDSDKK